ncbi:MAG TPA: DMT family transporter [Burkholderiaceae bacterium]|nr:DMT family transporter [Burkholderiaceae bacterium]
MVALSRKDWILLILLTLSWGSNWPIMKIGVQDFPPITFRALSMLGGVAALGVAIRMQGLALAIPRGQLGALVTLTIPNMVVWHISMILAVKLLSSGRAAILGYTMPVWAVLFGLIFFRERVTRVAWVGVACALAGAMLLLSSELATLAGQPLGSLLALLAAAGWGCGTVLMKRVRIDMPTIVLTFWMTALAAVIIGISAVLYERDAWRAPNATEWASILYNALIVLAFSQILWFRLARTLPPVVSSLSVMMIPVLGVFLGAWLLSETPHWQDYAAMLLILVAMSTVLLKPRATAPI